MRTRVLSFGLVLGVGFLLLISLIISAGNAAFGKWLGSLFAGWEIASGFDAAGSLIILLLWVYYGAQIFLLGAEFTWVYSNTYGSKADKEK